MKFTITSEKGHLEADEKELQPAFVKGAVAAQEGKGEDNPYGQKAFREAWDLGYQGVKEGKVVIHPETVLKIVCSGCDKDMGEKDGKGVEGISSSICQDCWEERYPQWPYPSEK